MADEKKQGFVEHITPRDVDFSQWYTDVILKSRAGGLRACARLHDHAALRVRHLGAHPGGNGQALQGNRP